MAGIGNGKRRVLIYPEPWMHESCVDLERTQREWEEEVRLERFRLRAGSIQEHGMVPNLPRVSRCCY